jgi:4-hydroxy-3-polyprenylbenzoate decarboxylase
MTYKDLPKFLEALEKKGLLDTIEIEVDPELEITQIADLVSKKYGSALKFTKVKGSKYPLVINAMGTYERLNLGLGVKNLDEIASQIKDYMNLSAYVTLKDKIKAIPKLAPLPFIFPRKVKNAPCQEVIEEPNLDLLPIIKCWPQDGGKYITLPLVFTKDPETGQQNVGMYRLQVYDSKTTGMHWHLHKDGKEIYEKYKKMKKKMPVSVALGCDPATIYAATAPLPKMIDEMIFAGYLKRRPIELTKCVTNDIYVPAHAEFILEGYVDLEELRLEGPFGDHTGYYSLSDMYPVFHLEKMTHKKNPIYPTTIVGKPPMEDCYLGKATERIFLPLIKVQCPEIIDMDFPLEGVFHNCAIVSIKKVFPLHVNKILYALWGLGQMMYTKMIIVVDESVNVHDYKAVAQNILKNATFESHLIVNEGPLDALDHASNRAFQGFRLGIDATTKLSVEASGKELSGQAENYTKQDSFDILNNPNIEIIPFGKKNGNKALEYLTDISNDSTKPNWIVLVDEWIDPSNLSTVSWKIFNNIDPKRDIVKKMRSDNSLFVGIDATKKGIEDGLMRPWPDDIEMSPEIVQKVNERWLSYGIKFNT